MFTDLNFRSNSVKNSRTGVKVLVRGRGPYWMTQISAAVGMLKERRVGTFVQMLIFTLFVSLYMHLSILLHRSVAILLA
jgi:hypothetical protein